MRTRKHITNEVEVWSRYALTLGDNGAQADARISAHIAPGVGPADEYVYLETNGDPVLVGWLVGGGLELAANAQGWIDADEYGWLRDIIADFA